MFSYWLKFLLRDMPRTIGLLMLFAVVSLLIPSLSVASLYLLSLFEFYFIYMMAYPPGLELLLQFDETITGQFFNHLISELGQLLELMKSYFPWLGWLFMPILMKEFLTQATFVVLSANLLLFAKYISIGYGVTLLASYILRKKLYKYVSIRPIVNSVLFAVLTQLAITYIQTNPFIAGILFSASLLPLSFFTYCFAMKKLAVLRRFVVSSTEGALFDIVRTTAGDISVVYHIANIALMAAAVHLHIPAVIQVGRYVIHQKTYGLFLLTTAFMFSLCCIKDYKKADELDRNMNSTHLQNEWGATVNHKVLNRSFINEGFSA